MITRDGDYYICQGEVHLEIESVHRHEPTDQELQARGNIKDRLAQIKSRLQVLKSQKKEVSSRQTTPTLSEVFPEPHNKEEDFTLNLEIPEQLLEIQQRIESLESKCMVYEIYNQKVERKGTIVERVKRLQKKLIELLKAKSIEVVTDNVIKYSNTLDERQQNMKQHYLYEVHTRTQGLTEELGVIQQYLQHLTSVQRVVNSAIPVFTLVSNHNQILTRKKAMQTRIEQLFANMKTQYQQLAEQIDSIEL